MKRKLLCFFLLCVTVIYSQDTGTAILDDIGAVTLGVAPTKPANAYGIIQGGEKKTASGILTVPIIFVRFKDDTISTSIWPDYNVLPSWAANLVDNSVPANGIYQNINLSNFFNRESGGDNNGTPGDFQVIGDVYYVTTDSNKSYYGTEYYSDGLVNKHVLAKLDTVYNVNFKKYDNWEFMVGSEFYKHTYCPYDSVTGSGGDGNLDHVFIFWREYTLNTTKYDPDDYHIGGYADISTSYTTSNGLVIKNNSGSTQFDLSTTGGEFGTNSRRCITAPAHEYAHFLFGGTSNAYAHWDGRVVHLGSWTDPVTGLSHKGTPQYNIGMMNRFALMTSSENYSFCALEKYLLGWLEPKVITSNNSYVWVKDTHVENEAIMVPISYDPYGRVSEFYLIENFQTTNSYPDANPFKIKQLFNNTFTNGLLVFHIENMDFSINYDNSNSYLKSIVDIECADGLWNWGLAIGDTSELDRTDDVLVRTSINRDNGLDERDYIPLTVGTTYWPDYMPLTRSSIGADSMTNHGRRSNKDVWLGDMNDFYDVGYNEVFSPWSNPSTKKYSGTNSNFGFQILYYSSNTKTYYLKFGFDETAVAAFNPSKPQDVKWEWFGVTTGSGKLATTTYYPKINWESNIEPDITNSLNPGTYKIYRSVDGGAWSLKGSVTHDISKTRQEYVDYSVEKPTHIDPLHSYSYYVKAVDTTNYYSIASETVSFQATIADNFKISEDGASEESIIKDYNLSQNYPNPFNPTTTIKYSIGQAGNVTLKIFNTLGEEVKTLVNNYMQKGKYEVTFDGSGLPSGVYIYRINVTGNSGQSFTSAKKLVLLK